MFGSQQKMFKVLQADYKAPNWGQFNSHLLRQGYEHFEHPEQLEEKRYLCPHGGILKVSEHDQGLAIRLSATADKMQEIESELKQDLKGYIISEYNGNSRRNC